MEVHVRESGNVAILDIKGEFDLHNVNSMKKAIRDMTEKGMFNLLINMDETSYLDSSGIGVLVSTLNSLQKAGGILKIMNIKGPVKKVFEFSQLDMIFKIFDNEKDALKSF
ncbi:MAG: anti-sigma factor antagonist [bacterium]|nr:MAG: anti-sigma factor antagonist [bacterium]